MHDKRYVCFLLFLGICFVNGRKLSDSHINVNLIDSVTNHKNASDSDVTKSSFDQRKMNNTQLETYNGASMPARVLSKSRKSRERKKKKKQDMFTRLLPMFIIPYLVQSAILPMMLMSIKTMLIKTFFVGKLAIILGLFNMLRSRNNENYKEVEENYGNSGGYGNYGMAGAGKDNQKESNDLLKQHYGYNGNEEFGAWVHH